MSVHLEKVLRHAEQKLMATARSSPTDMLDLYRNFLKLEEHRLRLAHRAGEGGIDLTHKRSDLIGVVLRHIWDTALETSRRAHHLEPGNFRMALVATGGFGRGELSPFSDVDVLFLYDEARPGSDRKRWVEDVVQQILYMLWDIGFKVGHASRTVNEAVEQGNADMMTKTALLEARLLAGDGGLFDEFARRFERQCVQGREMDFLLWRMRDQEERHAKYGGTVFVQEPQLKNGCGGLRDYQNLVWMARVRKGTPTTYALQEEGFLTPTERKRIDQSYDFILRLRSELHYQQKHVGDILTLKLQGQIANSFRYTQKGILRRTEALMRDYYQRARDLFLIANGAARRLVGQDKNQRSLRSMVPLSLRKPKKVDAFLIEDRELFAESRGVFSEEPIRLLRVFQILQQHQVQASGELESLVRNRRHLINGRFLYLPEAREMFLNILRQKGRTGRIVRAMHETGVLGRILPEFAPLTCLVQHEFYHRYTADEHTLRCMEMLDRVLDSEDVPFTSYRELFARLEDADILYLALIMHDVGKAANTRHHHLESAQLASRVARRLRLQGKRLRLFMFLVDHHMTLSETAQRRNLEDPTTIRDFARLVQSSERLDHLMLMTFSDAQGTGAQGNWTSWKELLVWQLYRRTREMLASEEEFLKQAALRTATLRQSVESSLPRTVDRAEVAAHFQLLPASYLATSEGLIVRHVQRVHEFLVRQFESEELSLRPLISWQDHPHAGHSEVVVVTWNRENLFGKVTGSFALAELNILSADIYRRADDIRVDTFLVCTERFEAVTEKRDIALLEKILNRTLEDPAYDLDAELGRLRSSAGRNPMSDELFPTALRLDNHISPNATVLDVRTPDYTGLLHDLANQLWNFGLEVQEARIATEKGAAFDTFHLTEKDGGKLLDTTRQRKLLRTLEHFLSKSGT